jgi:hypothetical protein
VVCNNGFIALLGSHGKQTNDAAAGEAVLCFLQDSFAHSAEPCSVYRAFPAFCTKYIAARVQLAQNKILPASNSNVTVSPFTSRCAMNNEVVILGLQATSHRAGAPENG